jgi:hypothetical protein
MWIAAHRSVCALTVATALTVGVVSAPPPAGVARAVSISDVALAASTSSFANSVTDDLEAVRDFVDRSVRAGLFFVASPVVVRIFAAIYIGALVA